ncbi:wiskott-Aldrich syndrome protein [Colossoma macropomum]|uniref:wiskott-Aldrich syndrome protein n=1 Tax=Colossoma macropomum TaxID=42526 RepID=UPI00186402A5|nr:wiskott-Aldrich syndrome protein [Colossoma macropomum]
MSRVLSSLLSTRENGLLFNMLGQDCSASACAVVQLLMATAACKGQKSEWKFHSCGVVCLVQDRKLQSSFIRLFSVKRAKLLWEQELYSPFEYLAPRPYFHTFPGDECRTGLNFADEEEAGRFYGAVQKCIKSTRAHPVFMRTHSLDSASGWLLREKLNSGKESRSPSPKTPPPFDLRMTSTTVGPGIKPAISFTPTSQSTISSKTLSSPNAASVSLAQKKGPLPPIPSNPRVASSGTGHNVNLASSFSIPLPPPYPAPKINPAGIRKSASFAPRGNYSSAVLKRQRSLQKFTADMQADTHYEEDQ